MTSRARPSLTAIAGAGPNYLPQIANNGRRASSRSAMTDRRRRRFRIVVVDDVPGRGGGGGGDGWIFIHRARAAGEKWSEKTNGRRWTVARVACNGQRIRVGCWRPNQGEETETVMIVRTDRQTGRERS